MSNSINPITALGGEVTIAKNELLKISRRLEDVRLRLIHTENQYERVIARPMPSWTLKNVPDEDETKIMADEAFAEMRTSAANEKDPMKRLCAQAALVKVIVGVMSTKVDRLSKLTERMNSGDAGSEAEIAVAKRRFAHIEQIMVTLKERLVVSVGDFARTRKHIMAKLVNLTSTLDRLFPRGCDAYADTFRTMDNDIENSLRMLSEMNEHMKTKPAKTKLPTLAFGGRNK